MQARLDVAHNGVDISRGPVLGANGSGAFEEHRRNGDPPEHELAGVLRGGAEGQGGHDTTIFQAFQGEFASRGGFGAFCFFGSGASDHGR